MTWRVAIVGAGIGREHMAGYLALGERFRVSYVCDLDRERGATLAGEAGAATTSEIDEVLADPDVDIIDICLPPALHFPVALRSLAAEKHVICEKPLAGSPREALELAEVAAAGGRRVFPVFQYRFGRAFYALAALRDAGFLGEPRVASLETHWNRGTDYYQNPWRGTWEHEMGGAVLSHAIHAHDLLRTAFGPVAEVSAYLDTLVNPIQTEDCAAILFRFDGGALATSSITLGAADDTSRLRLVYEHLTAESGHLPYAPGRAEWTFRARDPGDQGAVDEVVRKAAHGRPEGFAGLFEAIATDLETGENAAPSLADGVASIELAAAIYASHRSCRSVTLPLDHTLAEFAAFAGADGRL